MKKLSSEHSPWCVWVCVLMVTTACSTSQHSHKEKPEEITSEGPPATEEAAESAGEVLKRWGWDDVLFIEVGPEAIVVGDRSVVAVGADGAVDKVHKRGGENSLYIQPLFDTLTEEVSRHKQMAALREQPFEGIAALVCDRSTPYQLLTEVMYTAGQAQLDRFYLVIQRADGTWEGFSISTPKLALGPVTEEGGEGFGRIHGLGGSGVGGSGSKGHVRAALTRGDPELDGASCVESNVRAVAGRGSGALKYCIEKALQGEPGLEGSFELYWTIEQEGRVSDVSAILSDLDNSKIEGCLERVVKRWRFEPPGDEGCEVTQYFEFKARLPKPPPPSVEDRPLYLTVGISESGLRVAALGQALPPVPGCPQESPTVCARKGHDIAAALGESRAKSGSARDDALRRAVDGYDLRRLYNLLSGIKARYPGEVAINVGADGDIPVEVLAEVLGVVRFKRPGANEKGGFDTDEAFGSARFPQNPTDNAKREALFSLVTLAVIQ